MMEDLKSAGVGFDVVSIRNTSDTTTFNQEFIKNIAEHRHWTRQNQKGMVPA